MFPRLRMVAQELAGDGDRLRAFLADPEGFLAGASLPPEERRAILRLRGRVSGMVETGAVLANPLGIWP